MTVLVLAYYFPPLGMSGVQRITKFVKYLPEFGWNPIVVTPKPAGYFARDESLLDDLVDPRIRIVRTRSLDPTRIIRGRSKKASTVAFPKEVTRRRFAAATQLLFVPDNKIGWYPGALKAAIGVIENEQVDAILSTAPPYTAHLVGARLSRKFGIPLIVDFRDDWVANPRHNYPTKLHRRMHEHLESRVMRTAKACTTINSFIADALEQRNPTEIGRVTTIPQGFDPQDFPEAPGTQSTRCTFLYTGVFYDAQTPNTFLEAVARLIERNPADRNVLRLEFAGLLPESAMELARKLGIDDLIDYRGYLTHHEACSCMMAADVLWMTIGKAPGSEQISTGKLYEYFGTRKPILALVPHGAAKSDLERYPASIVAEPDDIQATASAIEDLIRLWRQQELPFGSPPDVALYDRRHLTRQLASILDHSHAEHDNRVAR